MEQSKQMRRNQRKSWTGQSRWRMQGMTREEGTRIGDALWIGTPGEGRGVVVAFGGIGGGACDLGEGIGGGELPLQSWPFFPWFSDVVFSTLHPSVVTVTISPVRESDDVCWE